MEETLHGSRIWQVCVHPDLHYYASVSADKSAHIYNSKNNQLLKVIKNVHDRSIRTAAWRPHQKMLALGSFDATMSIFAYEDPQWEFLAQLEGPDNEIKRVAWSFDGTHLASCSRDKSVWVWEVDEDGEDFECVAVLQEHTQDVKHVAWHSSEEILASASYDNSIRLWRRDDDEWLCVATLDGPDGHSSTVWSCDFDPHSMRLVSVSDDLSVKVWRRIAQTGGSGDGEKLPSVARWDVLSEEWELESTLPHIHTHPIYSVKWGKNGKIASTGADGKIAVYERQDNIWRLRNVFEKAHGVFEINSVDWLDDRVISGGDDRKIKIWTLDSDNKE